MEVMCELMKLKPEYIQEYIDMHDEPWPGLVEAIKNSGFLEEYIYMFGNLVIVVMKCQDFEKSKKWLARHEIFQKWTKRVLSMLEEDKDTFPINGKLADLKPIWNLADY